ncbi:CehA/McbA family metallohydrolase [Streptomyces sp. NPDC003442]
MPDSGFPPIQARGRGASWYRGDCHIHSVYSDGELTPEQLAADARAVGLDFIATTEHNSSSAHSAWGRHAADDFLVLLGEEVTTKTGHWLALGITPGQVIDWDYRVGDKLIGRCLDQGEAVRPAIWPVRQRMTDSVPPCSGSPPLARRVRALVCVGDANLFCPCRSMQVAKGAPQAEVSRRCRTIRCPAHLGAGCYPRSKVLGSPSR